MLGVKLVLGVILIKGFLLRATYSQCSGTNKVIYPSNGNIQSPNYPNELGKAANCTWKFSSKEKEYMLVLTVVKLRLYFVVDGKKKCSGSYILETNKDTVDCTRYVNPSYASPFCNVYYSSDKCSIKQQGCEITKQTAFPVQVTYKSDGRTVQGHGGGAVVGFKIEYKYIECAPETTTTMSTSALTTTEEHVYTTEEQKTLTSPSSSGKQRKTAIISIESSSVGDEATAVTEESQTDEGVTSQQKIIIIAASGGGGLLLIIGTAILIVCSCKRKRNSLVDEVHELSEITEIDQPPTMADTDHLKKSSNQSESQELAKNNTMTIQQPDPNIYSAVIFDAPCQNEEIDNPIYSTANEHLRKQSENSSSVIPQSKPTATITSQSDLDTHRESKQHSTVTYDAPCQSEEMDIPLYSTANKHLHKQPENASNAMIQSNPTGNLFKQSEMSTCLNEENGDQSDMLYSEI